MAELQTHFADLVQFFSDPSQPIWVKVLGAIGVVLAIGAILFGLYLLYLLAWLVIALIGAGFNQFTEDVKGVANSEVLKDLGRLKGSYDAARKEGLSAEDAMRYAGDQEIARQKKSAEEKNQPPQGGPPSSA